ncbi:hypothetical protein V5O48_017232 [Marasmius crinis-equi]|uniref:Transposase n=1 Tax=Marasmius crinis-equi TaxID=585013 RepID=A0ABR3EPK7_9AGAR
MNSRKRSRLSSKLEKHTEADDGVSTNTQTVSFSKTRKQWQEDRERFYRSFAALNFEARAHFAAESNAPFDDHDPTWLDDDDDDTHTFPLPPGQEGVLHGYSDHSAELTLMDSMLSNPKRRDMRTRSDRTQKQVISWAEQMPRLVDAYLHYQRLGMPTWDHKDEVWEMTCIEFHAWYSVEVWHPPEHDSQSINETLVYHGLLGGSPDFPGVAFHLRMFEVYRQIHRACPSFSINALARTLQNIHSRRVEARVQVALGQADTPICSPCTYEVRNEQALIPRMLIAIDGNVSLKMVDADHKRGEARVDTRSLSDPRWLTPDQVDEFQDEVKNSEKRRAQRALKSTASQPSASTADTCAGTSPPIDGVDPDDIAYLNAEESGRVAEAVSVCVERWKAAGPEAQKRMYLFFAITGIFLAVCRHGHLLVMCDMRRSGELMKYPLAVVNELLDRYGEDLGVGYDIMCAFWVTLQHSNKLQGKVAALRMRGVVPAFHGHAHNRKCQVHWHPMYVLGVGNEDFEECERTFSLSNRLASTTRLATPFHRQQMILEHFSFHSDDKDLSYGRFCYYKYREALQRLRDKVPLFNELCRQRGMTPRACEDLLNHERAYFTQVFSDPPELLVRLDYAEKLWKVWRQQVESEEASKEYTKMENRGRGQYTPAKVQSIQTRNRTAFQRWQASYEELLMFEVEHQIDPRWQPNSPEYIDTCKQLSRREYRRAVERLEKLVVARLMELTKLNLSGVGYRQRTQIAKALKVRAEAIKKAITDYNKAASALDPPRPALDWIQIVDMVKLADFDLLRDTETPLSELIWAKPENKEVMSLHFSIIRAREEINRLNVEITRKITHMLDEHADFYHAIRAAQAKEDTDLVHWLQFHSHNQSTLNTHVAEQLMRTSKLRGFTGNLLPGERIGRDPRLTDSAPLPIWATDILGLFRYNDLLQRKPTDAEDATDNETEDESNGEDSEYSSDEGIEERRDGIVTFMERLTVQ